MSMKSATASIALLLCLILPLHASATIYPIRPVTGDPLFVLFTSQCGRSIADPARAAQVSHEQQGEDWHVDVTAYLTGPVSEFCFGTDPPRTHAVPLGPAPEGVRYVFVNVQILTTDSATGAVGPPYGWTDATGLGSTPNQSISGLWLSPGAPGELTHITFAGYIGDDHESVFVTTQVFDRQGKLTPLTAIGWFEGMDFHGQALTAVRPNPEASDIEPSVAGDIHVLYKGCGRATLRFDSSVIERIETSEREIERVATPAGSDTCSSWWDTVDVEIVAEQTR